MITIIELTNSELHTGLLRKAWRHQQTRLVLLVTLTAHCPEVDSSNTTVSHKYRVRQRAGSSPVLRVSTPPVKPFVESYLRNLLDKSN